MFIRIVPINFDKLLQDGRSTTGTLDSKPSRVMKVAVNLTRVFVIAILRSKDSRADRTGEMLDMKLQIQGCDVATSQSTTTFGTDKTQTPKVIGLAKWILRFTIGRAAIDGEEFAGDDLPTVLTSEAVEMVDGTEGSDELAGH